jgi:hypothetical protein
MTVYAVSRVRLDNEGRVTTVLWGQVDTKSNRWVTDEEEASAAEVLDAIHSGDQVVALFPTMHGHVPGRAFVAVDSKSGDETIVLDGPATHGRELSDMDKFVV